MTNPSEEQKRAAREWMRRTDLPNSHPDKEYPECMTEEIEQTILLCLAAAPVDPYPVGVDDHEARVDWHRRNNAPVDAEVQEAVDWARDAIFKAKRKDKPLTARSLETLIRAVEENSAAYRMTKAMLSGALEANVNLHKQLEAATKNMGEK